MKLRTPDTIMWFLRMPPSICDVKSRRMQSSWPLCRQLIFAIRADCVLSISELFSTRFIKRVVIKIRYCHQYFTTNAWRKENCSCTKDHKPFLLTYITTNPIKHLAIHDTFINLHFSSTRRF